MNDGFRTSEPPASDAERSSAGFDATHGFYEDKAEGYAAATLQLLTPRELTTFLDRCPSGALLDLGCGAGRDLLAMRQAGRQALGLDRSEALARIARGSSGCAVVVGDLRRLPLAPSSLAGVWACGSLHHLERGDLPAVLTDLARVLAPDGLVHASIKAGRGERFAADGRRFVLHQADDLAAACERSGLRVVSLDLAMGPSTEGETLWLNLVASPS